MREEKERKTNENGKERCWSVVLVVACNGVCECGVLLDLECCVSNLQSSAEEINEMSSCSIQSCSSTPPPLWLVTEPSPSQP